MHLTLLACGHTICNETWQVETQGETFHRVYYVLDGTCHCQILGHTARLRPGNLYILPQNTPYTMEQDKNNPLHVVWQHIRPDDFQFDQCLWSVPIENNSRPFHLLKAIELTCDGEEFPQGDPSKLGNISKLTQVLLSFLGENLPILTPLDTRIAQAIHLASHHPKMCYTVQELADFVKLDRSHFSRLFQKELGITPQIFLKRIRLEWSAQLLLQGTSVADASVQAGYSDEKAFFRAFSSHFGTSPGKYRKYHILQP